MTDPYKELFEIEKALIKLAYELEQQNRPADFKNVQSVITSYGQEFVKKAKEFSALFKEHGLNLDKLYSDNTQETTNAKIGLKKLRRSMQEIESIMHIMRKKLDAFVIEDAQRNNPIPQAQPVQKAKGLFSKLLNPLRAK